MKIITFHKSFHKERKLLSIIFKLVWFSQSCYDHAQIYFSAFTNYKFSLFFVVQLFSLYLLVGSSAGTLVSTQPHAGTIGYAPVNTDYYLNSLCLPSFSIFFLTITFPSSISFLSINLLYSCISFSFFFLCSSIFSQSFPIVRRYGVHPKPVDVQVSKFSEASVRLAAR